MNYSDAERGKFLAQLPTFLLTKRGQGAKGFSTSTKNMLKDMRNVVAGGKIGGGIIMDRNKKF